MSFNTANPVSIEENDFSDFFTQSQDKIKSKQLNRMKLISGGLLAFAAVIYLLSKLVTKLHPNWPWVGFITAASEAGMVGGFADWFAVTALFRHPFGIKIPHTAIIPNKKDQFGGALGGFVQTNFLTPDIVSEQLMSFNIPLKAGQWLTKTGNPEKLTNELGKVVVIVLKQIKDEDATNIIQKSIIDKITTPEWGPPIGKLSKRLLDENRHLPVIDVLIDQAYKWAEDSGDVINRVVNQDMPKWAPKLVNNLLSNKVHGELVEFMSRVKQDPNHDMRIAINKFLYETVDDLQNDPKMIKRVEKIKQEILARDDVSNMADTIWNQAKKILQESIDDPESTLRQRLSKSFGEFGTRLLNEKPLRDQINEQIDTTSRTLTKNYASQVVSIISDTIKKWDTKDASKIIELNVGKDLQFIRINGTVVGALAGLAIYTITQILF